MVKISEEFITLDPRDTGVEQNQGIAHRQISLDGKVIGLLSNNKPNSELLLHMIADLIKEDYSIESVVEANKGSHRIPAPENMVDDLVAKCDVVITATAE